MNRRELLGVVGAMGTGAALGATAAAAEEHGKMADNKAMAPVGNLHLHFCGIHCAKKDPRIQIITQHYCGAIGDGMHQCLLYDSLGKNARLLGVEYIISDEIFRKLPDVEKRYWHPHTYEVLGGGLIAPGMKPEDEMAFMKALLTHLGQDLAHLARPDDAGADGRAAADVGADRRRAGRPESDQRPGQGVWRVLCRDSQETHR